MAGDSGCSDLAAALQNAERDAAAQCSAADSLRLDLVKRQRSWDEERAGLLRRLDAVAGSGLRAAAESTSADSAELAKQPDLLMRRARRAEEENELLRALLLLKNVTVELELSGGPASERAGPASDAPTPLEAVSLRGDPRSLRRLLGLVEQTKHLRMSYLLARAEAECLRQTIDETMACLSVPLLLHSIN